jgi:hypothetical protein
MHTVILALVLSAAPNTEVAPPHEYGLAAGQFLAGMGTALGGLLIAQVHPVLLVPVPLLVGFAVCDVGKLSDHYESYCGPAILGAYLGSLSVIPLAVLGASLDHSSGGEIDGVYGLLLGGLIGWAVIQPLTATLSARLWSPAKTVFRTMAPVAPPPMAPPVRGQVMVSLLSLAF